jgi:small subunit ribosomal protein S10e
MNTSSRVSYSNVIRESLAQGLFAEGVMVAKKDYNAPKHEELEVPNLQVIKAMQSLTSKGLVKTQFSWQYYYYTLTDDGIQNLREWYISLPLHLALVLTRDKASPPPRNRSCHPQKSCPPAPTWRCSRRRWNVPCAPW